MVQNCVGGVAQACKPNSPGVETCDGLDNDCNGVVDDATGNVSNGDAVLVSEGDDVHPAALTSLGSTGYMSAYSATSGGRNAVYFASLTASGSRIGEPLPLSLNPADAYAGVLAWTGDRYGVAWIDRRDARGTVSNYEIYFNIINPDGTKRGPDIRVTGTPGFSIAVQLVWTGNEFVVGWQDDGQNRFALDEVFAQRIDLNGTLLGANVRLIDGNGVGRVSPALAASKGSIALVSTRETPDHELMFATFDHELHPLARESTLSGPLAAGAFPAIVANGSEYVVAWYDPDTIPWQVHGAVRGELGEEIVAPQQITTGRSNARYPALLPYGDRVLLVWSDDRDGNGGYEIYSQMLGRTLFPVAPAQRLTRATGDSFDAIPSFGPRGEVGILFSDGRLGTPQVYFTSLSCVTNAP
jgi:hypothetical protein